MKQYIQFIADRLLYTLNYQKMYNVSNPFDFMDMISIEGKTNFFDRRVGEYQKSNVLSSQQQKEFQLDDNF